MFMFMFMLCYIINKIINYKNKSLGYLLKYWVYNKYHCNWNIKLFY